MVAIADVKGGRCRVSVVARFTDAECTSGLLLVLQYVVRDMCVNLLQMRVSVARLPKNTETTTCDRTCFI